MIPIHCKGCAQVLARTDGHVLIIGTVDDSAAIIKHPVTLYCPRIACRRTRGWQPSGGNGTAGSLQKDGVRVKSP